MATNGSQNIATAATGTILQGAGVGTTPIFSTATYPSTAGTTGNVLTSNGTNFISSAPSGYTPTPFVNVGAAIAAGKTAVTTPYCAFGTSVFSEILNISSTQIMFIPIFIDEAFTYTKIGVRVTNVPGAGSTIMLAIYDQGGTNKLPGSVLAHQESLDSSAAGLIEGTISWAATVGWYWLGCQKNSTGTVTLRSFGNNNIQFPVTNKLFLNLSNPTSTDFYGVYSLATTNTYGSWPTNPSIDANNIVNGLPIIYLR